MEPVIVITDNVKSFERYCMETGRNRETAIQITHPTQFALYPDCEIVLYGAYDMNNAYHSQEYRDHIYQKALKESKNL